MNFIRLTFLFFTTLIFSVSCSLLPISDVTRGIFSDIEKKFASDKRFNLDEYPEYKDAKVSSYLNRLTKKICELYNIEPISVVISDTIEAQAMIDFDEPVIYVSKGMLYAIKNEAELVSLLGHEVGHVYLKHDQKNHQSSPVPKMIGSAIETATNLPVGEEVVSYIEDINFSQFSQKTEREADEFGALVAQKMVLNAFEFARLLARLDQMADPNVLDQLNQAFKGSHQSLQRRSTVLNSYLKEKKVVDAGLTNSDSYLNEVRHLSAIIEKQDKDPRIKSAQVRLDQLSQNLEVREKNKTPLTVEEFLTTMNQLKSAAKDLNFLKPLHSSSQWMREEDSSSHDEFMMELVRVFRPWWLGEDKSWQKINSTLSLLARMGVGTIPVVGDAIDLYELLTGRDFVTGEPLTFGERAASAFGVAIGAGQQWRAAVDGMGGLKVPRSVSAVDPKEVKSVTDAVEEAIEGRSVFKKSPAQSIEDLKDLEGRYRPIKNAKNYETLKELAEKTRDKNIPDDWSVKVSKVKPRVDKNQGLEYIHPKHDDVRVRVMPGDPNSQFPNSREPYVIQRVNKHLIDKDGKITIKNSEPSHIPLKDYKFKNFWKNYGKK